MAAKRKKKEELQEPIQEEQATVIIEPAQYKPEPKVKYKPEKNKYKIGSIVFISKDATADLNGFKLFPQYKKYTYTVEAYDEKSDVYTLRRLNLSLRLKSEFIVSPEERAHDPLNRRQF